MKISIYYSEVPNNYNFTEESYESILLSFLEIIRTSYIDAMKLAYKEYPEYVYDGLVLINHSEFGYEIGIAKPSYYSIVLSKVCSDILSCEYGNSTRSIGSKPILRRFSKTISKSIWYMWHNYCKSLLDKEVR